MTQVSLKELLQQLAEERNFDLRGYKLSSLERRFRHRMFQLKIGSYGEYADYIRNRPSEVNDLLNAVLINVTQFFRDPQAWEVLRTEILPELTVSLKPGEIFRVWSAGCATGEEPYSVAILLSEQLGERIKDYDAKVYATDVDEDALNSARRGEYLPEKLRFVRPEWREKYFLGEKVCRVTRDIRRMVIFGRSNLVSDPPISHVQLLLCRNVLIYFDSELQGHILKRLHYALEMGGVLVLGKSESQLSHSSLFRVVHPRWRIFQRLETETPEHRHQTRLLRPRQEDHLAKANPDYSLEKLYHKALLETLEPGVLLLDPRGVIVNDNQAALRFWGVKDESVTGKNIQDTLLSSRCPELLTRLAALQNTPNQTSQFEHTVAGDDEGERQLSITLKSITAPSGDRVGVLIYVEDVSPRQKLHHTIEELQTTGEELQSTNEELETTNEELQSTNEELETTNEELQSTNEELETTNEELQALNEELGTTNEELEVRTKELDELNERYSETLERMPWPLMLVIEDSGKIQLWNAASEKLFGLPGKSVIGLQLRQLPFPERMRNVLTRSYRDSLLRGKPKIVHGCHIDLQAFTGELDVHFTPLVQENGSQGVIVAFQEPGNDPKKVPGRGKTLRSRRAQAKSRKK